MVRKKGIWNPSYIGILSFEVVSQFANYLVNPIVANYAVALGTTIGIAGFIAGLNSTISLALRPLGGLIFSHFDRKKLLIAAAVIFASSSWVCAVFDAVIALSLSRVLMGMAFILRSTLVVALASSVVPKDCVGQGVSIIGLAGIVSNALAPGIGSWIGLTFGYRISFFVSGVLFLIALLVAIFISRLDILDTVDNDAKNTKLFPRESIDNETALNKETKRSGKNRPNSKKLANLFYVGTIPIALVAGLSSFVFGSVNALILTIGEQRSIVGVSIYFFAYAICAIVARPLIGKMFDKYGFEKIFFPGLLLTFLSMIVLAFSFSAASVAIGAALLAFGQGSIYPCCQAESVREVPVEKSALAANTFYIGPDAGMAAGPWIGGIVLQIFGPFGMFVLNIGATALMATMYYLFFKKKRMQKGDKVHDSRK